MTAKSNGHGVGVERMTRLEDALDDLYQQIGGLLQSKGIGLCATHAMALVRLGDQSCTVTQLGQMPFRVRNLSYTVRKLEEGGFITKERGKDPRTQIVRLTKDGEKVAGIVAQALDKNPPRALARA